MVQRLPLRRRSRRILLVAAGLILLFIISISTIVRLYTDLQWYREVRFTSVFWTILRSEVLLGVGLGQSSYLIVPLVLVLAGYAGTLVFTRLLGPGS